MIRVVLSIALVSIWGYLDFGMATVSPLISSRAAALQFDNSDTSYLAAQYGMHYVTGGLPSILLLLLLIAIWWQPLRAWLFGLALLAVLVQPQPAAAYYSKSEYTEMIEIYPNETAFYIPDVGANLDSQVKMDSAAYYKNKKVPIKDFQIPHKTLPNSGTFGNYVVPAGRTILVDRTPYHSDWTKASERGTSKRDEALYCQDRDGHDVTTEITISTKVMDDDAALFLSQFGVKPPPGDRNQPEVIFTSVYYGRSLTEVMDSIVRGKVEALVCNEISIRPLDTVNHDAKLMMDDIQKDVISYFNNYGITLDYIGWAGTFGFSKGVQDAIDRSYVAEKDKAIAEMLQPYTATIQALAGAQAVRAFDGKLPSTMVTLNPADVTNLLKTLVTSPAAAIPPPAPGH